MSMPRVIWKYPNRRLYDSSSSRYIALTDIRALVSKEVEFRVLDKKNGIDITRCVLLQVLADSEQGAGAGGPVMSTDFLRKVIQSYGTPGRAALAAALERSAVSPG